MTDENRSSNGPMASDPLTPSERAGVNPDYRGICCAVRHGTGGGISCDKPLHHPGDHEESGSTCGPWPAENRPNEATSCGAVDEAWPDTPPCTRQAGHKGSHQSDQVFDHSKPNGFFSWPNEAPGAYDEPKHRAPCTQKAPIKTSAWGRLVTASRAYTARSGSREDAELEDAAIAFAAEVAPCSDNGPIAAVNDDLRLALNAVAEWALHDFKPGEGEWADECSHVTPDRMRHCGYEKNRHPRSKMIGRFCLNAIEAAGKRVDYPRIIKVVKGAIKDSLEDLTAQGCLELGERSWALRDLIHHVAADVEAEVNLAIKLAPRTDSPPMKDSR